MSADGTELVNRAHAADDRIFIYRDVAGECRVIRQDAVVGNDAIVRNVGVDHKKVVAADLRDPTTLNSPPVDRDTLTYFVAIAYFDEGYFAGIFEILIVFPNRGKDRWCCLGRCEYVRSRRHAI